MMRRKVSALVVVIPTLLLVSIADSRRVGSDRLHGAGQYRC